MRFERGLRFAAALALLGAPVSCAEGSARNERPLPPSTPTVRIALRNLRFEHPEQFPVGRSILDMHNVDAVRHSVSLVRLRDDQQGSIQDIVRQPAIYATIVVLNPEPGSEIRFGQDLTVGRYAFICFAKDPDGVAHYLKGMASDFRVA